MKGEPCEKNAHAVRGKKPRSARGIFELPGSFSFGGEINMLDRRRYGRDAGTTLDHKISNYEACLKSFVITSTASFIL